MNAFRGIAFAESNVWQATCIDICAATRSQTPKAEDGRSEGHPLLAPPHAVEASDEEIRDSNVAYDENQDGGKVETTLLWSVFLPQPLPAINHHCQSSAAIFVLEDQACSELSARVGLLSSCRLSIHGHHSRSQ